MAINLHEKWDKKIVEQMSHESFLTGKVNTDYEFTGIKTLKVTTLTPQALTDYTRSGANRYGTPTELQDTVQEMTMKKDRSFSMTIDKGNNMEQQMIKNAGKALALENKQIVVPEMDKYALGAWLTEAKKNTDIEENTTFADGDAVLKSLKKARAHFVNNLFSKDLYCYMGTTQVNELLLAKMILGIETLAKDQVSKGVVGQILGFPIVEVPDAFLGTDCNYLITAKASVLHPIKLNEAKVHQDPPGISGALLEGRYMYDAFVLDTLKEGLYASLTGAKA